MPTMSHHIRQRIAGDGPISVADYMADALSHPRLGYYMNGEPFGRDGDFITAPEISQMFGELIGLWCAVQWRAMGEPAQVNLVELGPGRGTLMADVLRAGRGVEDFLESVSLSLVEISPALKGVQEETLLAGGDVRDVQSLRWVSDFSEVPEGPLLVVANEFLDALPVHQFRMTAEGWRERMVDLDETEEGFRFADAEIPPEDGLIPEGLDDAEGLEEGAILEIRPAVSAVAKELGRRLQDHPGAALFVDYGHAQTAWGDTLQAVKGHHYHDPLVEPGSADLTAHVDFGAFGQAANEAGAGVLGPVPQGEFLNALGIATRAEALATASPAHKQDIDSALSRLTSDEGMGRLFKVMALTSPGMAPPPGFE